MRLSKSYNEKRLYCGMMSFSKSKQLRSMKQKWIRFRRKCLMHDDIGKNSASDEDDVIEDDEVKGQKMIRMNISHSMIVFLKF